MQSIEAQGFAKKEKSTMVLIGNHRTFLAEMKGFEPGKNIVIIIAPQ